MYKHVSDLPWEPAVVFKAFQLFEPFCQRDLDENTCMKKHVPIWMNAS